MNLRYKIMQFMSGRYGVDKTFYFLFSVSAVLALINCFFRIRAIQYVIYAIIIVAFLRFFSKNIDARVKENNIVTGWIYKLSKNYQTKRNRRADVTHIYKKCPNCKAVLRLPRKEGKHSTVCPKCGKSFKVKVMK